METELNTPHATALALVPEAQAALEEAEVELFKARSILMEIAHHPQGYPEMSHAYERVRNINNALKAIQ